MLDIDAFAEAMVKETPLVFTPKACRLYLICAVGFLCSTMDGYNGSLLNGLLQKDEFKAYFDGSNSGVWVSLLGFCTKLVVSQDCPSQVRHWTRGAAEMAFSLPFAPS